MSFGNALRLERNLVVRDRGAVLTALALAIILVVAFISGTRADLAETAALRSAAERIQQDWAEQPPKNPHVAAHYGILVYRPRAPLQAIEPGVLPYQGAVNFLEAHKRNAPMLSPASVRAAESRYGGTRFSPMLQVAGGFLALVLGFLVGSREARRGMSSLLKGAGAKGMPLVAAKMATTAVLVVAASAPSLVLAATQLEGGEPAMRYALLAGTSLLHLFVLAAIGVSAGQLLGSARFGLTAVAVTWGLGVLIIPRMADVAAEQLVPSTQAELSETIAADFARGPDGHGESEANAAFERRILDEYGVESVEELPVNFDALLMQADEEYRGGVYDRRLAQAEALREKQDAIRRVSWAFGPTPAMLDLSVRIAGADADTQRRFDESAERFRRDLVGRLNRHMAENSRSGDWEWTPEDGYYASFDAFRPPVPTLAEDLPDLVPAALGLLLWFLAAAASLVIAGRRFDKAVAA